jgi:hypothetical protein
MTSSNGRQVPCTLCQLGTYNDVIGSQYCLPCPLGTYTDKNGTLTCLKCSPGRFANITGLSSCYECEEGKSTSGANEGQPFCIPCSTGSYTDIIGSDICIPCLPGSYADIEGMKLCHPCPSGTSAAGSGQQRCSTCISGHYYNSTGAQTCTPCPTGKYRDAANLDATQCIPCGNGTFASVEGQSACVPCPSGMYFTIIITTSFCCLPPPPFPSSPTSLSSLPFSFLLFIPFHLISSHTIYTALSFIHSLLSVIISNQYISMKLTIYDITLSETQLLNYTKSTKLKQKLKKIGKYSPGASGTFESCTACPPGRSTNIQGSTICSQCGLGTFAQLSGAFRYILSLFFAFFAFLLFSFFLSFFLSFFHSLNVHQQANTQYLGCHYMYVLLWLWI